MVHEAFDTSLSIESSKHFGYTSMENITHFLLSAFNLCNEVLPKPSARNRPNSLILHLHESAEIKDKTLMLKNVA